MTSSVQTRWEELSIVMPCLNEAETLEICITKAKTYLERSGIVGEIIVADNGSTDGSQEIAASMGARVVNVHARGYGSAIMGGVEAAHGRYVIIGDADDSYDFSALDAFVEKLRQGADMVVGNRFWGGIKPGAMPPLHQYLGNPVLSALGRIFFNSPLRDFHCGLRGVRKQAYEQLGLQMTGMEFASEMIVKATLLNQNILEVPTILYPDGRSRQPHLRTWRDGWRHLRFLLLYSPRWLFLYPGLALIIVGLVASIILVTGNRVHSLLYASMATIIGVQIVSFALFTQVYATSNGLLPKDQNFETLYRNFSLELGLVLGSILIILGTGGSFGALQIWRANNFGDLHPEDVMRVIIPSVISLAVGFQLIFASFFLSILGMKRSNSTNEEIVPTIADQKL